MSVRSPGSVVFEEADVERIQRAQVALLLHVPPSVIDEMPLRDIEDVLAIQSANEELRQTASR
jgi:hypothetical protein